MTGEVFDYTVEIDFKEVNKDPISLRNDTEEDCTKTDEMNEEEE